MPIVSPDPARRTVEDFDFTFSSGQILPVTIDKAAGDTVSFEKSPLAIVINLVEKPALTNPDVILPGEEITILYNHLIAIQRRVREITDLTAEQAAELREAITQLATQRVQ